LSISGGEEKSEHSEAANQHQSTYSDGGVFFSATSTGTSGEWWLTVMASQLTDCFCKTFFTLKKKQNIDLFF
jgi:hypothetical protein